MSLHAGADVRPLVEGVVPAGLSVAFEDAPAEALRAPVVRFGTAMRSAGDLLVAPEGERLWRHAPWPAADALFELPPPADAAPVLLVGEPERRAGVSHALREREVVVQEADRLRVPDLERSATVVMLADGSRFPPQAFAVPAAGRLLLLLAPARTFGLQHAIDCLLASDDAELVDLVDAAETYSPDFAVIRRVGRVSAYTQRASDVYTRLGRDIELGLVGVARNDRNASST